MSAPPSIKRRKLNESHGGLSKPFVSPLKRPNYDRRPLESTDNAAKTPYKPSTLAHSSRITPKATPTAVRAGYPGHNPVRSTPIGKQQILPSPAQCSDPAEFAAQKALRALELQIRDIRNEIGMLSQAAQLSVSSTDASLKELAQKWKLASQAAADEVFDTVKQKVDQMGGVTAWRQSEKQKYSMYSGFQDAEDQPVDDDKDCMFDSEGEEISEEEQARRKKTKRKAKRERAGEVEYQEREATIEANGEDEERKEEEDEDVFTMEMMLQSLNMELDVLGYDPVAQSWIA